MTSLSVVAHAGFPLKCNEFHGEIAEITSDRRFGRAQSGTGADAVAAVTADLFTISPENRALTATTVARRDAAIITEASVTLTPGPRAMSRVITITAAWVPTSWGTLNTLEHLASLPDVTRRSFGGQFGMNEQIVVPLPAHVSHVLKSPVTSVHPRFLMAVESQEITDGPKVADGSWIDVRYACRYDVYGGI